MKTSEFILKVLGLALAGQLVLVLYFGYVEIVHPEKYDFSNTLMVLAGTLITTYMVGVGIYESSKNNKK